MKSTSWAWHMFLSRSSAVRLSVNTFETAMMATLSVLFSSEALKTQDLMVVLGYGMLVTIVYDWLLADQMFEIDQDAGIKTYIDSQCNHRAPVSDPANLRCGSHVAPRHYATTWASSRSAVEFQPMPSERQVNM